MTVSGGRLNATTAIAARCSDRISQVIIEGDAEFTRAEYRYDALGRRTEKQVWRRHTLKAERTQYAWSGLQMVERQQF